MKRKIIGAFDILLGVYPIYYSIRVLIDDMIFYVFYANQMLQIDESGIATPLEWNIEWYEYILLLSWDDIKYVIAGIFCIIGGIFIIQGKKWIWIIIGPCLFLLFLVYDFITVQILH